MTYGREMGQPTRDRPRHLAICREFVAPRRRSQAGLGSLAQACGSNTQNSVTHFLEERYDIGALARREIHHKEPAPPPVRFERLSPTYGLAIHREAGIESDRNALDTLAQGTYGDSAGLKSDLTTDFSTQNSGEFWGRNGLPGRFAQDVVVLE